MDIIHHGLIGMAGFQTATDLNLLPHGTAFLAGSVFPDLDVAFMALGKRFYLKNHQALTHSLPLSPLYALLLASPFFLIEGFSLTIVLAAMLGIWLHVALDWCNTYRIAPFAPFSYRRYSLDAIFFIDAITLSLTASYYLLYYTLTTSAWLASLYGTLFILYIAFKWWLQGYVKQRQQAGIAIPSSLNPFSFFIYKEDNNICLSYHLNLLTATPSRQWQVDKVADEIERLACSSITYRDMKQICRALQIVEVERDENGTTLVAKDMAVRNFGGRFGQTTLRFNQSGELIDEVANI